MKPKLNFIYLLVFVLLVITVAEWIGIQSIPVGSVRISLLPLVFAILITMVLGLAIFRKGFMKKIYSKENVDLRQISDLYHAAAHGPVRSRYRSKNP
ncbi:hypothetical protein HMSSN036_13930 [Paenibacillus macerans]|nr:hypothetical protein HMSSN036_13930 [Paenibacillus macerans]